MKLVASLIIILASLTTLRASTVTFTLVVDSGTSTFELFATSSPGDNAGIASYGVPLLGSISALIHLSPNGTSGAGSGNPNKPVGFTLFRSADNVTTVTGSQDTITPTPFPVYGFGQSAGDLATVSADFVFVQQQAYGAPLLLAQGTYGATAPSFDTGNVNLGANTFNNLRSLSTSAAMIVTQVVPEPTTACLGLLGVCSLVFFVRRRDYSRV